MAERSEAVEEQAVQDASAVYSVDADMAATKDVPFGYQRTEVGVIPEDWKLMPLRELAEVRTGIAKNTKLVVVDPVSVHYLRVANVQDGYLDISEMKSITISKSDLNRYRVLRGDVLMNEGGDLDKLGRGALWQGALDPCVHQNHVFVVRCRNLLEPSFLAAWSSSGLGRAYFLVAGKQTTNLASINKTALGGLPVVLPSKTEQRAIATALSDADALIESLDRLLAKKRAIKQAAMQQLLSGQTRLPGFTGEWSKYNFSEHAILKARIGWQGLRTDEYLRSGDHYLVTGTDFENGSIKWSGCYFVDRWRYEQDKNIQLTEGDVLLTKDGTIGKVGFVDSFPGPATLNSGVYVVRPVGDAFEPKFIFYVFESTIFGEFLRKLQAGSTISHLYQKDFVGFSFSAPNIKEQAAIATVLSDMDVEIEVLERRRDKARQIKQGMMQQLLTGRVRLVQSNVAHSDIGANPETTKGHSKQFNEAVVISMLAKHFGTEEFPLGRKRYTKLSYLLHRHTDGKVEDYLKKAAGPYNPKTKYGGAEKIALKKGYLKEHKGARGHSGFIAADNVAEAKRYFHNWYGLDAVQWLDQFRFKSNDELEVLATVDMAAQELRAGGRKVDVPSVKGVIQSDAEWQPKLNRKVFSDEYIAQAITQSESLLRPSRKAVT